MNKYAELMREAARLVADDDLAHKLHNAAEEHEQKEPAGYGLRNLVDRSWDGISFVSATNAEQHEDGALLPLYTHPPADAGKAIPEGWREKFKREVYHNLAAADNQDIPMEEYPDRILSVLDSLLAAPKPSEQQPVAEVKYGGYASGNELVWAKGAGLQFLPEGAKLYAASIHAPTPVAYLDVGAGGYMDLGTDLTEDQVGSLPWGRHILAIVGTYGADGYVPAEQQPAPDVTALVEALESAYHLIANHSGETLPTSYASDQMDMIDAALAAHRREPSYDNQ